MFIQINGRLINTSNFDTIIKGTYNTDFTIGFALGSSIIFSALFTSEEDRDETFNDISVVLSAATPITTNSTWIQG